MALLATVPTALKLDTDTFELGSVALVVSLAIALALFLSFHAPHEPRRRAILGSGWSGNLAFTFRASVSIFNQERIDSATRPASCL